MGQLSGDFWSGFAFGLAASVVLGVVVRQFRYWYGKWKAMTKPQAVVQLTARTPWQIVWAGLQAGCLLVIAAFVVGAILFVVFGWSP